MWWCDDFQGPGHQSILDLSSVRALVSERCQEFKDSLLQKAMELLRCCESEEW